MGEGACVHHLFERQVARTPQATAAVAGRRALTYAELDAAANRFAHYLREERGVGVEEPVGLLAGRDLDMLVAVLGVLKAGAAFVPLEASYPLPRTAATVAGAGLRRVVATAALAGRLRALDEPVELVVLDALAGELAGRPAAGVAVPLDGANLAYIMHTSGSTGVPKGVLVPHAGLVNYLRWCCEAYGAASGAGSAVQSPISTSMIFPSLFAPLCVGGAVTLLAEQRGLSGLVDVLTEPGRAPFSFLKVTPSQLRLVNRELEGADLSGRVHTLVIGAEPLDEDTVALWRRQAPGTRLVNEYGPTETVVGRVTYTLPPEPAAGGPLPVGTPIAGTRIHLVDGDLDAVAGGAPGEICIGGVGIARGYAGNPALTAEMFVPDPLSGEPGARMYRTGDVGRMLPSGDLACLGRRDDQVKIRGYRVEPGDVAAALRAHARVADAHVTARTRAGDGQLVLVAYVVAPAGAPPAGELRAFLEDRVPDHMIPASFVTVDEIPMTAVGKVDRRALPDPPAARPALAVAYVAPRTDEERAAARLWSETLGLAEVGVTDDFLALGGDSLLAGRLQARMSERFGVDLTLTDVMEHRTVVTLLQQVETRRRDGGGRSRPKAPPLRSYRRGRQDAGDGGAR